MFSLRVFDSNHQTNMEVGLFVSTGLPGIFVYENFSFQKNGTYQVFPGEPRKQTFYTLPKDHVLLVYAQDTEFHLLCQTRDCDNYLYFRPPPTTQRIFVMALETEAVAEHHINRTLRSRYC